MAIINPVSAALRIRNELNRAVCSVNGVNPDMTAESAAGFVTGIQYMYNRGKVLARIYVVSEVTITDSAA
jgi:hypothetical protein